MKHTFKDNTWQWYEFSEEETDEIRQLAVEWQSSDILAWIEQVEELKTNNLMIDTFHPGTEWVAGTLVIKQDLADREDKHVFHFFVVKDFMITSHLDFSVIGKHDHELLKGHMEFAENAIEGFSIILGLVMTSNLIKIDSFEERLNDLLWKMKEENSTSILEEIYQCRHEILVLKHLMIPIKEIKTALEEAFGKSVAEKAEYRRTCLKIERGIDTINEYQVEVDTLINLEEVVSSHRGNEIMKTLTVLTTLFMPITALGALWGMNFENMPELKWKYGYLLAVLLIVLSTLFLYIVLKKKGWFGDILRGKKRNSFFK